MQLFPIAAPASSYKLYMHLRKVDDATPRNPRPTPGHPHSTLKSHQMHVSSPRDWTAQINSKHSHNTEPLHVRNGSGVQVPLDSSATDRGAPSS